MEQFKKTQGNDIADDAEDKRTLKLARKYENKPYHVRWLPLYFITNVFGYLFNAASGLGAFALVYYLILRLTQNHLLAVGGGVFVIILWEILKRYSIGEMFKDYFADNHLDPKLVVFTSLILIGSAAASFFGAKNAIPDLMQGPQLEAYEDKTAALRKALTDKEQALKDLNNDRSNYNEKGIMLYKIAQNVRPKIVTSIDNLQNELAAVEIETNKRNDQTGIQHKIYVSDNASHYAIGVALFDILLLLCFYFTEQYDYKEAYFRGVTHGQLAVQATTASRPEIAVPIKKNGTERIKTERLRTERNGYTRINKGQRRISVLSVAVPVLSP